jgi:hypothetical protein
MRKIKPYLLGGIIGYSMWWFVWPGEGHSYLFGHNVFTFVGIMALSVFFYYVVRYLKMIPALLKR